MKFRVKVDIDNKNIDLKKFIEYRAKALWILECRASVKFVAETKKGYHIILEVKSKLFNRYEDMIFLQAILGSDPLREALNYRRLKVTGKPLNVLFNKKEKFLPELTVELDRIVRKILRKQKRRYRPYKHTLRDVV